MDELQTLMLSLRRAWADILTAEKLIAERDKRIKELEDQLTAVSKEA